jgi:uridine phosphorylase
VVSALEEACLSLGFRHHLGLTATASGFYAPQGRAMRTLPVRYPQLAEELRRQGVANLEMESSALFVLASLAGLRAGTICAAYAQRIEGTFLEGAAKEAAEARCIDAGLTGIHLLWEMDQQQDGDPRARWSSPIGRQGGER